MYIRRIEKKNRNSIKTYLYYRLVHGYKVGDKVRQQTLLNLGKLEDCPVEKHKALADRIEMLLTGSESIFNDIDESIEALAQRFVKEIQSKGLFPSLKRKTAIGKAPDKTFEEVNLESIEEEESKTIGGEWLCKQAFDRLGIATLLSGIGMNETQVSMAQMLLTAKLIHPSSELETERWLQENSGAMELYGQEAFSTTRYRLYQAATLLYEQKEFIEKELYSLCTNLFSQRNKIVIYDLTNLFFEGQMRGSQKANFGRSKEKRSDCRLIGLAMAIDNQGFVRYSQLYPGNISESATLDAMLKEVEGKLNFGEERPIVVMDAGISTEENLESIKGKGYDYVCVSRMRPASYAFTSEEATILTDTRGAKIEVRKISVQNKPDLFLHIKSEQKALKEKSMDAKITDRFEERLNYLNQGLTIPKRTKKTVTVHEAIGRLKDKYSKAAKLYKIEYQEDVAQGVVTKITWTRLGEKEKPAGEYFLRYSKESLDEAQIWDLYNLTREVEASFRCLKTDLNIRPIHHQKDQYIEPHIWLGIIAYQVVNYIRQTLKQNGIHYSWKTIVEKMQAQRCSMISMDAKDNKRIYTKLCTRPSVAMKKIYDALKFKDRPYVRKSKVVTQL
jgi:hypothetical protein